MVPVSRNNSSEQARKLNPYTPTPIVIGGGLFPGSVNFYVHASGKSPGQTERWTLAILKLPGASE